MKRPFKLLLRGLILSTVLALIAWLAIGAYGSSRLVSPPRSPLQDHHRILSADAHNLYPEICNFSLNAILQNAQK